ncbi:MAG: FG-GAP-like repeat-containing protein [Pyrinomonadaceae bacterium]|nr:FG-GAP-like repeat-containing protein [Pyrinomonadaceae bacterium]
MKFFRSLRKSMVWLLLLPILLIAQTNFKTSEEAYRANNRGVSLLEQFKSDDAEKEFRQALTLKPNFKLAKINLAIALFNSKKLDEAKKIIAEFLQIEPNSPQAFYVLGLIARSENNLDEALKDFRKVLEIDSKDVGANVNLGQLFAQKRDYANAIKVLQAAYDSEPFNLTAIYNLATSLQRSGEREKSAELLKRFQVLRDTGAGVNIGLNYLEQGRYAEAIASTGAESELVNPAKSLVKYTEATTSFFGGKKINFKPDTAALFDYDGDGFLDLVISTGSSIRLYQNHKGKFIDISEKSGDLAKNTGSFANAIVAGDYDNDLKPDLLVVRADCFSLYQNNGDGKFTDVTKRSGLLVPQTRKNGFSFILGTISVAWVDFDHDGDLDIFAAGGSDLDEYKEHLPLPNRLFRNNNDGTFTEVSETAKIADKPDLGRIVPTDFNNSRDVDLLVVGNKKTYLYSNQRNDTFKNVADEAGLNIGGVSVAAADINKDGFTDYFIGDAYGKSFLFINNGNGKFTKQKISNKKVSAISSQFFDYDNDGLIDLITSDLTETKIWRNLGNKWQEIGKANCPTAGGEMLSGDIDNDGDIDLIVFSLAHPLKIFRNDGGNLNNAETLNLQGRVSNKSGIGAKVVMRSGSLAQQLESYSASPMPAPSQVHFGLGKREKADSIRILWSSGIVQSETDFVAKSNQINIQEVDRKPASCPYLYTWDGEKFAFVTDFLGGGEMGGWAGKGVYNFPKSDEFVRIPQDKLKAKNGFYEIRVTNELEEVMYLDKVKLVAVEHDENSEIFPNEGLGQSEKPKESIISTQNAHPPISAVNSEGENIVSKIKDLDRVFYDDFTKQEIRGYADEHSLTLNLDDKKGYNGRTILLLTGWTDYAFSSDNVRASQSGKSLFFPYLQVKNAKGEWQTVIDSIGIPIGRPQTLLADLTGKFLSDSREVRIVTNFRTYWDKIAVDTSPKETNLKTIEIEPTVANLRERGYSAETKFNGMDVPDYGKVSFDDRWKNFAGRFTRTGDVKPLLKEIDDVFVIAKAGDEFVLSFKELPAPPKGKTYTFLLFADGYSKEMDINSGSPDAVYPLPFKGMKKYPYGNEEAFPMTEEKRRIYDETLTRFSRGGLARF